MAEPVTSNNPLNQQAFNSLLAWLDVDRDKAAIKYESIRLQLIRFFQFNDCPYAEDYADDVIQRVTRKLAEGSEIKTDNHYNYFRGVARNALLEYWKQHQRKQITLDQMPATNQPVIDPQEIDYQQAMAHQRERAVECMPKCLAELPAENRQIFLRYHQQASQDHIKLRAALARELNLEINALRSRITRIRERLERCIRECLAK